MSYYALLRAMSVSVVIDRFSSRRAKAINWACAQIDLDEQGWAPLPLPFT
jgi:hypothetical protein